LICLLLIFTNEDYLESFLCICRQISCDRSKVTVVNFENLNFTKINHFFLSFFLSFLSSHSLVKSEPIKSKPARVLHTLESLHRLVFLGLLFFLIFLPFSEDLSVWPILITVGLNIGSLDNTRVAVGWGGEFLVGWRVCDTRFLLDH